MGYYADVAFAFTFNDEEALKVAAFGHNPEAKNAEEVLTEAVQEIGEESDWSLEDDGVSISGWSGGKFYEEGLDSLMEMLSGFATGEADCRGEEGNYWRIRLFKNGTYVTYEGEIVYPGDPGPEA